MQALAPATAAESARKSNIWCCRRQGEIRLELSLPRSGFTPGEAIPASALVSNQTSLTVRPRLRLVQNVKYK